MTTNDRQEILLEAYERAAQDMACQLEEQLAKLRALVPEVEERLRGLRRRTSELEAPLAADGASDT